MSKICLITAQNVQMSPDSLRRRIVDLSAERNIGAFFPTASNVGLTEYEDAFVCSISDDFLYDNCERLLLPDDCWYNGTCSSAPFELFIGDCGQCPLTEFEPASVRLECLHENLVRMFNDYNAPQERIRIIRQLSSE